ncbi:hypothetical protein [Lichenicoccus roseus]|uniref:hypothetical protein n=1 Tax=Lichenicoccus roseus TaxID=2683649 RepID=UPI0014868ECE|nr:hypothetical protein [Lichenicoccus roseus]
MIEQLAAARGPTGCLMASPCTRAGKPITLDMFNLIRYAPQPADRRRACGRWQVLAAPP